MDCMKCRCGCDNLSKEELKELINSTDRVQDFMKNEKARELFRRMFYPDEADQYVSQPSGSRNRPTGKPPKPNAIKYLEILEDLEDLINAKNFSDEVIEEFGDRHLAILVDELLEPDPEGKTREEKLKALADDYRNRLYLTDEYKLKFKQKLREAHEGKINLKKQ